jgi:hypothetical protein
VPGVYFEPRPRAPETVAVRTDVTGFIGFEPRVRDGTTPSTLVGNPPAGHAFRVDVAAFQLVVGEVRGTVPATRDVVLSSHPGTIPMVSGESITYALAVAERQRAFTLVPVAGAVAPAGAVVRPTDAAIEARVAAALTEPRPWIRIADVTVRRDGTAVWPTVHPPLATVWPPVEHPVPSAVRQRIHPALSITRCDDWPDYLMAFGAPEEDGTLLGPAVRAYFANGGRRCWIATVRRPRFEDAEELARVLDDMVGLMGSSEREATGLERLLMVPEVTIVDAPDLYARRIDRTPRTVVLPPRDREACFIPCTDILEGEIQTATSHIPAWQPIFTSTPVYDPGPPEALSQVFETQRRLVARTVPERWRAMVLLSVPLMPDVATGRHGLPTGRDGAAWIGQFDRLVKEAGFAETDEMACGALYWPWALYQEQVGAPVLEMPPSAYAAGIVARRDLARGPQISPANETLKQVVGLGAALDDAVHGRLYVPDPDDDGLEVPSVNVLRAFPGYGIQLWGARTLSTDTWLRYIAVRRTLTAIELRMKAALDLLVFEPNTPTLWLQITQTAFSVLMPLFESGALRGERPEEAFYVRCDGTVNPPEAIAAGQLLVEVGVAVAAPAEFIVFRVGRREGVVEVVE